MDRENDRVREATAADRGLLARATLENLNWNGDRLTMRDVGDAPLLRHYYEGWPTNDELGLVAQDDGGEPVGVVWLRFFTADDPGYGFVADTVPELSIWVEAGSRGRGIGAMLLGQVSELARSRGISAISLSVEDGNPAARLYARHDFRPAPGGAPGCFLKML